MMKRRMHNSVSILSIDTTWCHYVLHVSNYCLLLNYCSAVYAIRALNEWIEESNSKPTQIYEEKYVRQTAIKHIIITQKESKNCWLIVEKQSKTKQNLYSACLCCVLGIEICK